MKKKTPRVLVLSPFFRPNTGGVETHLDDLCEYLRGENIFTYVLTYQPLTTNLKAKSKEKRKNLEIHRLPWLGFNLFHKLEPYPVLEFLYLTPYLFVCTFFFLLKNNKKIDVIHSQGFNASFIARIIAPIFKKKYVASTHAIYELDSSSFMSRMIKWTLSGADKVLTLSLPSRRELIKVGVPDEKIEVYHYWVNQKVFKPLNKDLAKKKLKWEKKFSVLFVGRLIEIKGMDILLDVAKKIPQANFFFIGSGPYEKKLKEESKSLKNIKLLGRVDNYNLPIYYSAADVFVIPSKYEEGLGRVILEALSSGTPVIGSNKGGIPEAISADVGILVKPTKKEFFDAINTLYKNKKRLLSLTKNARKFAVENFSFKNAKKIVKSYYND